MLTHPMWYQRKPPVVELSLSCYFVSSEEVLPARLTEPGSASWLAYSQPNGNSVRLSPCQSRRQWFSHPLHHASLPARRLLLIPLQVFPRQVDCSRLILETAGGSRRQSKQEMDFLMTPGAPARYWASRRVPRTCPSGLQAKRGSNVSRPKLQHSILVSCRRKPLARQCLV